MTKDEYTLYGELRAVELIKGDMILLTIHKWSKPDLSVTEIKKLVGRGVVTMTFHDGYVRG